MSAYSTKTVLELLQNPLLAFVGNFYFLNDIYEFGKAIKQLKEDENYSKSKILCAMVKYADIYERFRPHPIVSGDLYYGTVTIMDSIYEVLANFLELRYMPFIFSKSSDKYYMQKSEHCGIYWDDIIADIDFVDNAIITKAEDKAIEIYGIMRKDAPYSISYLIKNRILRIVKNITDDDIKFGKDIIVKGIKISADNTYSFESDIYKKFNAKSA
ncbi:MAG: hypothetical protein LBP89_01170 [Helicobacteraceae bacterium]|nr:hypothetical protein [Helicobacteraceae bacterium]